MSEEQNNMANPPVSPFEKGGSRGISSFHAPSAADVIREARTWIHTPFLHQGRIKGKAGDCVAIAIGVAHVLGLSNFDYTGYGRQPVPEEMGRLLDEHLDRVDKKEMRPGDVLWLRFGAEDPSHLAILTAPDLIIHINEKIKLCREHRLNDMWRKRIFRVYRYRGIAKGE